MRRILTVLALVLALGACGFHPRAQLLIPAEYGAMRVESGDPYDPLALGLTRALERSGNRIAGSGEPATVLKVSSQTWDTSPVSVDQFAQVREYATRYRVEFVLVGSDEKPLGEPQRIELTREYSFDQNASAGSPAEQELIRKELRRDMEAAILRRVDVLLRPKR
ncbi:LPS assembly lipoprotein LptE [Arenimonas sp.]|uniref:LPS-assembly lipoprotein LptE n=1 Tax=Arenimonas sp. TaxID=1872635 RepID=UPI0039E4A81D